MGALPNVEPRSLRKPITPEKLVLDKYGRDPQSPVEVLRRQTDYSADTGYSPLYHAMLADLPRLLGGSAVAWALVMTVLRLSLGAPRDSKGPRREYTLPISTEDLAELCRANVRDIQRQLAELKDRGIISSRKTKEGYSLSLLLSKWQGVEDYAVWKRRQVVIIDEPVEVDEEDEETVEFSKEAVLLTKKPQAVRAGRASRAVKISGGVKALVVQNDAPRVDLVYNAVLQSGCITVAITQKQGVSEAKSDSEEKGEQKATKRHICRGQNEDLLKTKGLQVHPRSAEVVSLFDPLLQKSGARLLSPDAVSLSKACSELGEMDHEYLVWFVLNPKGRGARPISSPAAVVGIVKEARKNWEALKHKTAPAASVPLPPESERARTILSDPSGWSAADVEWAKEVLS